MLVRRFLSPVAMAVAVVAGGCGSDAGPSAEPLDVAAVTIAARPDGGYIWADVEGTIGRDDGSTLAEIDVDTDGQRGLLGLTVDPDGRIFFSYTDATFTLFVAELVDGEQRIVWEGPTTVQGGNGGRLIARDGELIVGVGLLNDREGQADPDSIVGKLIALDPDVEPDEQQPRIVSGPWFNPFAFDAIESVGDGAGGAIWVADNHPRDGDERLARGDLGLDPDVALVLPADSAPSGLAATNDALYICSYNDLTLTRHDLIDGVPAAGEVVAQDCILDVELLADGSLAYSTGAAIVVISP